METNYFETLYTANITKHIQKKKGFSYISWAAAWRVIKLNYPDSSYKIYEAADGCLYHTDWRTAWVKVGVTVAGIENIEYMPISNNANGMALSLKYVVSVKASNAISRALTKACARHGVALCLYLDDVDGKAEAGDVDGEAEAGDEKADHALTDEEYERLLSVMTPADIRRYQVQLVKERAAHPEAVFSDYAGIYKLYKNSQENIDK